MDHENLLIEIGCEELPPKKLHQLARHLADNLVAEIDSAELKHGEVKIFATPRRLAVWVAALQKELPAKKLERQGPSVKAAYDKNGTPTIACLGFAKSCGVSVDQLITRKTDKGEWVCAKTTVPGKATTDLIPELVASAIKKLPISKPMRWGNHDYSFVRPVHWLVVLFGKEVVPFSLMGVKASHNTHGHRFHHPQALSLRHADDYANELEMNAFVIADFAKRRENIRGQINKIAAPIGNAILNEKLLDEVTAIVEWPTALLGKFSPDYLKIPQEVLITAMQVHQKCFALQDAQGNLAPNFILVSNIASKDPSLVVKGNERVINARLSDAAFFYHNDCQTPLKTWQKSLSDVIFQKQLGTMADKAQRIQKLAGYVAKKIAADVDVTKHAALLCKCDLLSEMVGEFPELQGVMGYYYALHAKENKKTAVAIRDHYCPRFSKDELPATKEAAAVAIADRLDTLIGIIGINKSPTGDKDPYGLRRAALGVIRIIIEMQLPLAMDDLLKHAVAGFAEKALVNKNVEEQAAKFIHERLRYWYLEQKVAAEVFAAVAATAVSQLLDFDQRIRAVEKFQTLPEAQALSNANKRVGNILKKQGNAHIPKMANEKLFESVSERNLYDSILKYQKEMEKAYEKNNYTQALSTLAGLKQPVDAFFDEVMIMVDDKKTRENRLALLFSLQQLFTKVADISLLP